LEAKLCSLKKRFARTEEELKSCEENMVKLLERYEGVVELNIDLQLKLNKEQQERRQEPEVTIFLFQIYINFSNNKIL